MYTKWRRKKKKQHQEPNLFCNIWFVGVIGMQMGWKQGETSASHGSKHYSKHLFAKLWFGFMGKGPILLLERDWQPSKSPCLWSSDGVRDIQQKIKEKENKKKRTAIHHNTIHSWFIIQARVSVIQHSGGGACSRQARVKLYLKILFFGFATHDNGIPNKFTIAHEKCIKGILAYVFHIMCK